MIKKLYWPLLALGTLVLLCQGLIVPFWGDDYVFLLQAQDARLAGEPWWSGVWPAQADKFWRPLGEDLYWRFVAGPLNGNVVIAHLANLGLLLAAAACIGWLISGVTSVKWPELDARMAGWVGAFFYLIHAAHFLPLVWVSAANSSIVVALSALTLGCWVRSYGVVGSTGKLWSILALLMLVAALLSKEIGVVLPSLAAIVALWLWPQRIPTRSNWITAVVAVLITVLWLLARQQLVVADNPEYALSLGSNLLRNAASLLAFALNTPREALRFFVADGSVLAVCWAATCALLQGLALLLLLAAALRRLKIRGLLALTAFGVVAAGPYFIIAQHSYAYYVALSLIPMAIVAGLASVDTDKLRLAAGLALASSLLATGGSHLLPYPGLLARAAWGERQLQQLEQTRAAQPNNFSPRLRVLIENEHEFYAIGIAGLAYRLNLRPQNIITSLTCQDINGEKVLLIRDGGDASFDEC